jgi:hypothetical protein
MSAKVIPFVAREYFPHLPHLSTSTPTSPAPNPSDIRALISNARALYTLNPETFTLWSRVLAGVVDDERRKRAGGAR